MNDYARPTMLAEKALKDLHNAMLDRNYSVALMCGLDAIRYARETMHAIVEMEQQQDMSLRVIADRSTCQPPKGK